MSKVKRLVVQIPFPGFYESSLSSEVDHVEEYLLESLEEKERDEQVPVELQLSSDEFSGLLQDCITHSIAFHYLASQYAACFNHVAKDILDLDLKSTYESMSSPREYNFTTDRLFVEIPLSIMRKLFTRSKAQSHATLATVIKERFTSYDGFSSFYSNRLEEWLVKPLVEWDHNELGTLLIAVLVIAEPNAFKHENDSIEERIFSNMVEGGDFDQAFDRATDWPKFEEKVQELRDEKKAELDPDFVLPTPRCTRTEDMFDNQRKDHE